MNAPDDFWSRRKAAARAEEARIAQQAAAEADAAARLLLADRPDDEVLAELNLPDPDSLQPGDSILDFMAKAVPDRLRRRALRRLWAINPTLANLDGLIDYGEDYTDAACVIENLQTAYQVGRGMLAHVEELARQAEAQTLALADPGDETAAPALSDAMPEPDPVPEPEPEPEPDRIVSEYAPPSDDMPETDQDLTAPAPRRMRFAFEG